MIITAVLEWIWTIVNPLLALMPVIDLAGYTQAGTFWDALKMAFWMFPISTVMTIWTIQLALWAFRMIISFLKTLWGVLPVV